MKILLSRTLICIAVLAALAPARAEDYPTRALRVITANSAGGTSDIFVRALAEKLQVQPGAADHCREPAWRRHDHCRARLRGCGQ
jgi:tripartite-type tricarboxylate transporter receptor subunit TctC